MQLTILHQNNYVIKLGLMLRVRQFVHVHLLILVYYAFPQLEKPVLIHSLIDILCMLLQHCGMPLIYILDYCPLMFSKKESRHIFI